jgi:hypothetical protein
VAGDSTTVRTAAPAVRTSEGTGKSGCTPMRRHVSAEPLSLHPRPQGGARRFPRRISAQMERPGAIDPLPSLERTGKARRATISSYARFGLESRDVIRRPDLGSVAGEFCEFLEIGPTQCS